MPIHFGSTGDESSKSDHSGTDSSAEMDNERDMLTRRLETLNHEIDRMKRHNSRTRKTIVSTSNKVFVQGVVPNFGPLTGGTVVRITFTEPIREKDSVFQVTFVCTIGGTSPPVVWSVTVPYNQLIQNQAIQFTTPDLKALLRELKVDASELQRDVVAHIKIINIVHSDQCYKAAPSTPIINVGDTNGDDPLSFTFQWLSPLTKQDVEQVITDIKKLTPHEATDTLFNALYRAFASGQLEQSKAILTTAFTIKELNVFDLLMRADPKTNKTPFQIGLHFSRNDFIKSMLEFLKKESDRLQEEDEQEENLLSPQENVNDEDSDSSSHSGSGSQKRKDTAVRKRLGSLRGRSRSRGATLESVFATPTGKSNTGSDTISDGSITDRSTTEKGENTDIITIGSEMVEGVPIIGEEYEEESFQDLDDYDDDDENDDTENDHDDAEELRPEDEDDPLGLNDHIDAELSENIDIVTLLNDDVKHSATSERRRVRMMTIISLSKRDIPQESAPTDSLAQIAQQHAQQMQLQRTAVDRKYDLDVWRERFQSPDLHNDFLLFPKVSPTEEVETSSPSKTTELQQISASLPSTSILASIPRTNSFTLEKKRSNTVKALKPRVIKNISFGEDIQMEVEPLPSNILECTVSHQSNFFKTSVYFEIDDDKKNDFNEEALNMTHMFERRETSLPFHVRQCLRFMNGDILVKADLENHYLSILKQRRSRENNKFLPNIPYDVNACHTFEVDKQSKSSRQSDQVDNNEDTFSSISTNNNAHCEIIQEHEARNVDPNFVLDSFEATFPVTMQLKEFGINPTSQDLLMSSFSWSDEHIDGRRKLLFEHCALNFANFEDIKKIDSNEGSQSRGLADCLIEDVFITVTLWERQMSNNGKFRRISESFHYKRSAKGGPNAEEVRKDQLSDSLKDSVLKGRDGSVRIKVS
jgi:hypothetical protein